MTVNVLNEELDTTLEDGRRGQIHIVYHVFTDNMDFFTEDEERAHSVYEEWAEEHDRARLYIEHQLYDGEEWVDDLDENCLESVGGFPL